MQNMLWISTSQQIESSHQLAVFLANMIAYQSKGKCYFFRCGKRLSVVVVLLSIFQAVIQFSIYLFFDIYINSNQSFTAHVLTKWMRNWAITRECISIILNQELIENCYYYPKKLLLCAIFFCLQFHEYQSFHICWSI